MKKQAKITLVGAGPGDPELITIKGLKALQSADVVLYDALSNPALLAEAPADALKIYVGKRANNHRYKQEEINLMLVQYAYSHGHVVRLKGGDSFIFGLMALCQIFVSSTCSNDCVCSCSIFFTCCKICVFGITVFGIRFIDCFRVF